MAEAVEGEMHEPVSAEGRELGGGGGGRRGWRGVGMDRAGDVVVRATGDEGEGRTERDGWAS